MYPLSNLKEIKDENLQQELAELQNNTTELERYHKFAEVNELLEVSEIILANEKNVVVISECNKKIENILKKLMQPVQEKLSQLDFLKKLIEKYCDQNEVQVLNSALAIQEKKLKNETVSDSIDPQEIEKHLSKIDSICHKNLKKILGKIKQILLEKDWDARYADYFTSQLELISLSEKEINEKPTEISVCFDRIKFVIESITEFETNHDYFTNLTKNFTFAEEYFNGLTNTLLNLDTINSCKDEIEYQIETLRKEFAEFDPRLNSLDTLSYGLQELDQKLKLLDQLNHDGLQNQQMGLISLVKNSRKTLIEHSEKLSHSSTKCAKNKYQAIEIIKGKVDLLLKVEIEDDASNQKMTDNILELKQTINEAKAILSEYRGISLLRCFATLWGGGKVTSELLVNKLEGQLIDLQNNMSRLSPNS